MVWESSERRRRRGGPSALFQGAAIGEERLFFILFVLVPAFAVLGVLCLLSGCGLTLDLAGMVCLGVALFFTIETCIYALFRKREED